MSGGTFEAKFYMLRKSKDGKERLYGGRNRIPIELRFWTKVDKRGPNGCWLWTATTNQKGYGRIRHNRKLQSAHRVSYELCIGPVPDGLFVLHRCDNPRCVNPTHLFLGTNDENMADKASKGRQSRLHGDRNPNVKITAADAQAIKQSTATRRELARRYGVCEGHVSHIRAGRSWRE